MRADREIFKQKIQLPFKIKNPVLAVGAQRKNTICFVKDNFAYLSRVHMDLDNLRDFYEFEGDVKYFLKKRPRIIACDLHPEYASAKFAFSLPTKYYLLSIQHHHAHIVSCMAENGLKNQKVIGVAFDGTGLGSSGSLWGAEFLICDYKNFKRCGHLREIPLLGGERAILEPWRLAVIWLYLAYREGFLDLRLNFVKRLNKDKWRVLKKMYLTGFNSPLASSAGRLFDAVASLVLERYKADFEAELAIKLEKLAVNCKQQVRGYNFKIVRYKDRYVLDPLPMIKQIILDLNRDESKVKIAYRFHFTVAEMIHKLCLILRDKSQINKIVLSGGVFQNKLLLSLVLDLLYKDRFQVFTHKNLSCSDSSVSLGQAVIAGFLR